MLVMVFDRFGEPDVMQLRDVAVPKPQEGEVLIRVGYSSVNPADSKTRGGRTAHARAHATFPFVTGMDAAGVVERTGPNVSDFRQGDRVITWGSPDGKARAAMLSSFVLP